MPNESQRLGIWSKVWSDGEVDILFGRNSRRSPKSQDRFLRAFKWEFERSPANIPNWAWGLAYYSDIISAKDLHLDSPRDFEWGRLQEAWEEGRRGSMGTKAAARAVLGNPTRATSDPNEEGMPR